MGDKDPSLFYACQEPYTFLENSVVLRDSSYNRVFKALLKRPCRCQVNNNHIETHSVGPDEQSDAAFRQCISSCSQITFGVEINYQFSFRPDLVYDIQKQHLCIFYFFQNSIVILKTVTCNPIHVNLYKKGLQPNKSDVTLDVQKTFPSFKIPLYLSDNKLIVFFALISQLDLKSIPHKNPCMDSNYLILSP